MKTTAEVVRVKQAMAWIEEQDKIHLTATVPGGGPVVLTAEETRRLAQRLERLAQILEAVQERSKE
ncbi:MAG: hypothetical protein JKY37_16835 [Nannocystaceae bacterium]|nr:hypothetical protein [Nannocystaceae bacterium]